MPLLGPPTHGWRRDARVWIAVALAVYALLGFFAVPAVLRSQIPKQAGTYLSRKAVLADASFNPFTLRTSLEGFALADKDGAPLAGFEQLVVDFQASSLFRRAWTFRQVRLVKPKVIGRVAADGRPTAADLFEPKPDAPKPKKEFKLPRALIHDLTIDAGTIEFHDASSNPPFDSTWEPLSVRIGGLSTIPDRSGDHVLTVGIEGRGEARWSGRMSMEPLRLEGKLDLALRGLDRAWAYAGRNYPIVVTSGESHVSIPYLIEKPSGGKLRFEAHDVTFDAEGLAMRPRDADDSWARIGRVDVSGGLIRWPEQTVEVAQVRITEPSAKIWRTEDNKVNWMQLFDRWQAAADALPAKPSTGPPWKAVCRAVEVTGGSFDFEDRAVTPRVALTVTELASQVENVTSEPSSPMTTRISAKLNGSATTTTKGTVVIRPPSADVEVTLDGFQIRPTEPYVTEWVDARIPSGVASMSGRVAYRDGGKPIMSFEGRTALDGFSMTDPDGGPVLSWDKLAVEDIRLALAPNQFKAKLVSLNKPFAQILIDRDRKLSLSKLVKDRPESPAAAAETKTAGDPFPIEISAIRLVDGRVDYGDASLILPFRTKIHAANGSLNDLSKKTAAGSRLLIEGKVDEHGYMKTEGTIRVFDPLSASDVKVLFRNLEMNTLTPYTAEFAGYSIQSGRLDLAVEYKIQQRALLGNHQVTATALTLGGKVDGAKASLPLRLAVALLKDKDGKIDIGVPIEGSVDDPKFGYRTVIWEACKRVMVNVTTAPFRFLGRLVGIEGDDLELVSFDAGRSVLLPPEEEKLAKLVEALKSRPELVLQVGGRFDPAKDAEALRLAKLDAAIAARREASGADIDAILEGMYLEKHGAGSLEPLRQKHTSTGTDALPPADDAKKKGKKEAAPPAARPPGLDTARYFDEIRAALLADQTIGDDALTALARARSDAIVAALTGEGGIEATRVTATEIGPIKKKKEGQTLVACELAMPVD